MSDYLPAFLVAGSGFPFFSTFVSDAMILPKHIGPSGGVSRVGASIYVLLGLAISASSVTHLETPFWADYLEEVVMVPRHSDLQGGQEGTEILEAD